MKLATVTFLSALFFLCSFGLKAQSKKIVSYLYDSDQPVVNMTIFNYTDSSLTFSNSEGSFLLQRASNKLLIRGGGYLPMIIDNPFPDTIFLTEQFNYEKRGIGCQTVNSRKKFKVEGIVIGDDGPVIGAVIKSHDSLKTYASTDFYAKFTLCTNSESIAISSLGSQTTVFLAPYPDTFFIKEAEIMVVDRCYSGGDPTKYLSPQSFSKKKRPFYLETESGKIYVYPAKRYRRIFNSNYKLALFPKRGTAESKKQRKQNNSQNENEE